MRIDRSDDGDERPDTADAPEVRRADAAPGRWPGPGPRGQERRPRSGNRERGPGGSAPLSYRATVDAVDRAYAIDQGYARVQEIEEKTVTPAMRRIEAEDPDRHSSAWSTASRARTGSTEKIDVRR